VTVARGVERETRVLHVGAREPIAVREIRAEPQVGEWRLVAPSQEPETSDANAFLRSLTLRGLSLRTVRAYAMDLVIIFRWAAADSVALRTLDELLLLEFLAQQRAANAKPRSINRRLCTCRQFFRFLSGTEISSGRTAMQHSRGTSREHSLGLPIRRRGVRHNRLRVKVPRTLVAPLERDEVREFLSRCERYRDLAVVYLMLLCGLRSHEVLALRLQDVSYLEGRILVRGKGSRERALPLAPILSRCLTQYLRLERPEGCESSAVFVVLKGQQRGQPMTLAGLRSLFRVRRRTPSLARANPHRFRHTFGSDLARLGVGLPVLQKLMGHAHPETTMHYINLSMPDVAAEYRRAMAKLRQHYEPKER
jgi:site-specific recombinase XerD